MAASAGILASGCAQAVLSATQIPPWQQPLLQLLLVQQAAPSVPQLAHTPDAHRVAEAVQTPLLGVVPQHGSPGPPQAPHAPLLQIPLPSPTQAAPADMQMLATQQPPEAQPLSSQQGMPGPPQVALLPPAPVAPPIPPSWLAVAPPLPVPRPPPAPAGCPSPSTPGVPPWARAPDVPELLHPMTASAATARVIPIDQDPLGIGDSMCIQMVHRTNLSILTDSGRPHSGIFPGHTGRA
jgi:hypothetical protein